MKKFTFLVPVKGAVETVVMAENEEQARQKMREGKEAYESHPEIDTWYISRAILEEVEE